MDIGNLPVFNGQSKKSSNRSFDSNKTPQQAEETNTWEEIGDYDQPPSNSTNADEEEEEEHEQVQIPTRKQINNTKEKKDSDEAVSIAAEAAVKAAQQHKN